MKAEQIKECRERAGMTREALADKLGVNAMTVYRWERGAAKPHRLFLREIRRILNRKLEAKIQ